MEDKKHGGESAAKVEKTTVMNGHDEGVAEPVPKYRGIKAMPFIIGQSVIVFCG